MIKGKTAIEWCKVLPKDERDEFIYELGVQNVGLNERFTRLSYCIDCISFYKSRAGVDYWIAIFSKYRGDKYDYTNF